MGTFAEDRRKRMSAKHKMLDDAKKLLPAKVTYTKEDLDIIIPMLKKNMEPYEINEHVPHLSNTQIKKIRFIIKNGEQDDIDLMYECKYMLSRIKRRIQNQKKKMKAFDRVYGKYPYPDPKEKKRKK